MSRAGVLRGPWPRSTVKHTVSRGSKSGALGVISVYLASQFGEDVLSVLRVYEKTAKNGKVYKIAENIDLLFAFTMKNGVTMRHYGVLRGGVHDLP